MSLDKVTLWILFSKDFLPVFLLPLVLSTRRDQIWSAPQKPSKEAVLRSPSLVFLASSPTRGLFHFECPIQGSPPVTNSVWETKQPHVALQRHLAREHVLQCEGLMKGPLHGMTIGENHQYVDFRTLDGESYSWGKLEQLFGPWFVFCPDAILVKASSLASQTGAASGKVHDSWFEESEGSMGEAPCFR